MLNCVTNKNFSEGCAQYTDEYKYFNNVLSFCIYSLGTKGLDVAQSLAVPIKTDCHPTPGNNDCSSELVCD